MPIFILHHNLEQISNEFLMKSYENITKNDNHPKYSILTYWLDEEKHNIFILFKAEDKLALRTYVKTKLQIDNENIYEVNNCLENFCINHDIVKGFGTKPSKTKNGQDKKIIVAFYLQPFISGLNYSCIKPLSNIILSHFIKINQIIKNHKGKIISHQKHCIICTFDDVANTIKSIYAIRLFIFILFKNDFKKSNAFIKIKISVSANQIPGSNITNIDNIIHEIKNLAFLSNKSTIVMSSKIYSFLKHEGYGFNEHIKRIKILSSNEEYFIHRFFYVLDKNLKSPDFSILSLAKEIGVSKSTLYRTIVSLTKMSPQTFIKEYKLIKSSYMLKEGLLNISEIAFESGFGSPSYFSKAFKNYYGYTPSVLLSLDNSS